MKFTELNLPASLLKSITTHNYDTLTPIQEAVYGPIISGCDIVGISPTGSGKTLAFLVPLLQKLRFRALIILPTRELAHQVHVLCNKLRPKSADLIIGGQKPVRIRRDIVIGTSGRILWYLEQLDISDVELVVIDEADKMLEPGFKEELQKILEYFPVRQTLLFSATPGELDERMSIFNMKEPILINSEGAASQLIQEYYAVSLAEKIGYLHALIRKNADKKIMAFFSTCKEVKFYWMLFKKLGLNITMLTGKMKQQGKIESYDQFCRGGVLFCTDLGARGLDFEDV